MRYCGSKYTCAGTIESCTVLTLRACHVPTRNRTEQETLRTLRCNELGYTVPLRQSTVRSERVCRVLAGSV